MAIIRPFRALRPVPEKAEQVSCVPYDVPNESEVRAEIQQNPLSFLRVTRSEAEFEPGHPPPPKEVFARSRKNLQEFVDSGVLFEENEPALYVYRLASGEHSQTGVVACCSLDEYEQGVIKKHEKTRPDKVEDRTEHMLAVRAQTGLIFLTYRGTDEIGALLADAASGPPLYDFACALGVRHTLWKVRETSGLIDVFRKVPAIYIADGHHRAESADLARKKLKAENPDHTGDEEYNFVLAGIFPAEELKIMAYNRAVSDLNGLSQEEFVSRLSESFIVGETDNAQPDSRGNFCMYLGGKWYALRFAVNYIREPDPIERLDVTILQDHVLKPILAINDVRTDTRITFIGGGRGTSELERLVNEGDAEVAFSLFPTAIEDVLEISDLGQIMPPKSTWFEPKLKDGLLVHPI